MHNGEDKKCRECGDPIDTVCYVKVREYYFHHVCYIKLRKQRDHYANLMRGYDDDNSRY